MSLYEVLGVPRHALPSDIRRRFRAAMLVHHPDRVRQVDAAGRPLTSEQVAELQREATARTQRLSDANDVLSDEAKRAEYDATLRSADDRSTEGSFFCAPVGQRRLSVAGLAMARRRWRSETALLRDMKAAGSLLRQAGLEFLDF